LWLDHRSTPFAQIAWGEERTRKLVEEIAKNIYKAPMDEARCGAVIHKFIHITGQKEEFTNILSV
jgi:hypothetical protein